MLKRIRAGGSRRSSQTSSQLAQQFQPGSKLQVACHSLPCSLRETTARILQDSKARAASNSLQAAVFRRPEVATDHCIHVIAIVRAVCGTAGGAASTTPNTADIVYVLRPHYTRERCPAHAVAPSTCHALEVHPGCSNPLQTTLPQQAARMPIRKSDSALRTALRFCLRLGREHGVCVVHACRPSNISVTPADGCRAQ